MDRRPVSVYTDGSCEGNPGPGGWAAILKKGRWQKEIVGSTPHGYPPDFDTAQSPYKVIIDIVMAADCLDAATDTIGRSYSQGKTFDMYRNEVEEGAGTRYAPFLPELLSQKACREDISYLLGKGRERMYRETYRLLRKMLYNEHEDPL